VAREFRRRLIIRFSRESIETPFQQRRVHVTIKGGDEGEAIATAHMAREHVSLDELHQSLREHGISGLPQVALAVLEVDGSISCLKYDEIQPTASTHLAHRKFMKKHE
jgi:uncharacterized membrane protein YcaP (DUF421 family)